MFGPQDSICFPAPLRDLSRIRKLGPDGKLEEEVQVMSELGFEVGMLVMLFFGSELLGSSPGRSALQSAK